MKRRPYDPSRQARAICKAIGSRSGYTTIGRALEEAWAAGASGRYLRPLQPPPDIQMKTPVPSKLLARAVRHARHIQTMANGPRGYLP